jgi:hypothetical protein
MNPFDAHKLKNYLHNDDVFSEDSPMMLKRELSD